MGIGAIIKFIVKRDQAAHAWIMARFPRAIPIFEDVLESFFTGLTTPAFALIATLLLVPLVATNVINWVVALPIAAAWLVTTLWIARSQPLKRLTVSSRWLFVIIVGLLLGFSANSFGKWSLKQYTASKIVDQQVALQQYPVVDFEIDPHKRLSAKNRGKFPITEVQLVPTKYEFDFESFKKGELQIASFSKIGWHIELPDIGIGKQMQYDLTNPENLMEFGELKQGSRIWPVKEETIYYVLKFNFIDSGTGKRYTFYRVTSGLKNHIESLRDDPNAAMAGPEENIFDFLNQVPEKLIAHQRKIYGTEIEEYKP